MVAGSCCLCVAKVYQNGLADFGLATCLTMCWWPFSRHLLYIIRFFYFDRPLDYLCNTVDSILLGKVQANYAKRSSNFKLEGALTSQRQLVGLRVRAIGILVVVALYRFLDGQGQWSSWIDLDCCICGSCS